MLINDTDFGRLGNRLFLFAHLIAFSEKFKVPVINPRFSPYRHVFPAWRHDALCRYFPGPVTGPQPFWEKLGWRFLSMVRGLLPHIRWWKDEELDFDRYPDAGPVKSLREKGVRVFSGWLLRGHQSVQEFRELILPLFLFDPHIEQKAAQWIQGMRQSGAPLIGVHVRWEDYRGTDHFFELPAFILLMEKMEIILGRKCRFLVFSNEKLPEQAWGALDVQISSFDGSTDLCAMSRCDYLIGPPSTFSGWASFRGKVPLYTMASFRKLLSLEDFRHVGS